MKDCVIGEMYLIDTSKVNDWSLKALGSRRYVVQYEGYNTENTPSYPYKFKVIMGSNDHKLKMYTIGPGKLIHFHGSERLRLKAL